MRPSFRSLRAWSSTTKAHVTALDAQAAKALAKAAKKKGKK